MGEIVHLNKIQQVSEPRLFTATHLRGVYDLPPGDEEMGYSGTCMR